MPDYLFFSSRQVCKNDRMSEPITTTSSMISIVLKVFFFCICFLISFDEMISFSFGCIRVSTHPKLSTSSVVAQEMEVLSDPGVKSGYVWQVEASGEKKYGMHLRLRGGVFEL